MPCVHICRYVLDHTPVYALNQIGDKIKYHKWRNNIKDDFGQNRCWVVEQFSPINVAELKNIHRFKHQLDHFCLLEGLTGFTERLTYGKEFIIGCAIMLYNVPCGLKRLRTKEQQLRIWARFVSEKHSIVWASYRYTACLGKATGQGLLPPKINQIKY